MVRTSEQIMYCQKVLAIEPLNQSDLGRELFGIMPSTTSLGLNDNKFDIGALCKLKVYQFSIGGTESSVRTASRSIPG